MEIIILSILAVLAGADSYDKIEQFGKEKIKFLRRFLELRNGIPSHDTINRIFQMLNPNVFGQCFAEFTEFLKDGGVLNEQVRDQIAIDGKTIRGSRDSFHNKSPLHLVHAWSVGNKLCLGQVLCGEKDNEITTIPQIIDMLDIKNSVITIDAIGTQTAIAQQIIEKGGDYILAVKGNQQKLLENVNRLCKDNTPVFDTNLVEKSHGRIETRRAEVFDYDPYICWSRWKSLKSVIRMTSTREFLGGKSKSEVRYYISSLETKSEFIQYIRSHWEIENKLHWVLDMTFNEDAQRKRAKHAAVNFAIVRKLAFNIIKNHRGTQSYTE